MDSYKIAITGKGGCGKSTLSGLIIGGLIKSGHKPVLAIDADPNQCLDTVLGVQVENSVGQIREDVRKLSEEGASTGMSKRDLLELKIAECLVEADDFDLISMGRSEGPGCYCYANNVLGDIIREIEKSYPYVVIDNEAGLENLSRRIVNEVDLLVVVGEPSLNGIKTVQRVVDVAHEMKLQFKKLAVIINKKGDHPLSTAGRAILEKISPEQTLLLPWDGEVASFGEEGKDLTTLPDNNKVVEALQGFLKEIM